MKKIQKIENKILRQWVYCIKRENSFINWFKQNFIKKVKAIDANMISINFVIEQTLNKNAVMDFYNNVAIESAVAYAALLSELINAGSTVKENDDDRIFAVAAFKLTAEEIAKVINRDFLGDNIIGRFNNIVAGAGNNARALLQSGIESGLSIKQVRRELQKVLAADAFLLERLVRTEAMRINNDIALQTYAKGKAHLHGIMFMATLDHRTCEACGSHDRNEYFYESLPPVDDAPFIPMHPMCRCAYLPVSKIWDGKDKERASMGGYTKQNYSDWLRSAENQDAGFAKNILGKNYNNWLAGSYSVGGQLTPQLTVANYLRGK
jgi:SPP1 gp7 family putative phage head morphogenesis protein